MAKKEKGKKAELQLIDKASESANDIWLAGLAAFEKAQREGGKVFSKLVKEGKEIESRTLEVAGNQLDEIKNRASGTWDKLEHLFEEKVHRTITKLGVPSGKDVRNLAKKVDDLSASVESGGKTTSSTAAKPKAQAKQAAPAAKSKPSVKKAAAPKPVAQGPDDLQAIEGIGPALERKLIDHGVTSYRQIAGWTSKDVEEIESKVIRFSGRVTRDNWIAQAKAAHQKKYGKKP